MLAEGFILMVVTQIWKKIAEKFGVETGRFMIHCFLFAVCLIYSGLRHFGYWDLFGEELIGIWTTASGSYEVLKTIIEKVINR